MGIKRKKPGEKKAGGGEKLKPKLKTKPKSKNVSRTNQRKKQTVAIGRPSGLTDEVKKVLIDSIELGLSYEQACACAGIGYSTFREWMQKGMGTHPTRSPEPGSDQEKFFVEFVEDINKAIAESERALLQRINTMGHGDWRADAWILERRFPTRWSNQQKINQVAEEKVQEIMRSLVWFVSPEAYRELTTAMQSVGISQQDSNMGELQALYTLLKSDMLPAEVAPLVGKAFLEMKRSMVDAVKADT